MITDGPGLVSRVSQLRPWWRISEWGLVQRFSFCRHSAADWEDERGSGERRESVLSLTLPHFGHFVLILKYFPKSAPFFFSYWENSSFFFFNFKIFSQSASRYEWHTISAKDKNRFGYFAWVTDTCLGSSELFSLSLSYVRFFHLSLSVPLYLASLFLHLSLCLSQSLLRDGGQVRVTGWTGRAP